MKKNIVLFLLTILVGVLCLGCTKKTPSEEVSDKVFQATVIENKGSLLVSPDEDSAEYKSSDKMVVATQKASILDENKSKIDVTEIQIGDVVEITYNGMILESYPAQITADRIRIQ